MWATGAFVTASLQIFLASAGCPSIPVGTSSASYVHKAVSCVNPANVQAPAQSIGNVYLKGLHTGVSASHVKCMSTPTSLIAETTSAVSQMIRGSHTCTLKSISAEKSGVDPEASAQMTFEYTNCTGVPTMGTVVLPLQKVPATQPASEVEQFLTAVCGVQTTTPSTAVEAVQMSFDELLVGNSSCKGEELMSYDAATVPLKATCRQLCIAEIQKYEGMLETPEACTGYSFGTAAKDGKSCRLYKGAAVKKISDSGTVGWNCWNMTKRMSRFEESTAAPPTAEQLAAQLAAAPKLKANFDGATRATVTTYVSTQAGCFPSFDWILLKDANSAPATLKVSDAEWDAVMALIPVGSARKLEAADSIEAGIIIDAAAYSPVPVAAAVVPSATTAAPVATAAPKTIVTHEDCVVPEVGNAIITGFVVPLTAWAAVAMLFHNIGQGSNDGDVPVGCKGQTIMILVCCAFLTAAIVSFVLVSVLAILFKPMCESSNHDLTLIKLTGGITAMVACSSGLFYLSTKHHSTFVKGDKNADRKYMVVAVEDGNKMTPLADHEHVHPGESRNVMSSLMSGFSSKGSVK